MTTAIYKDATMTSTTATTMTTAIYKNATMTSTTAIYKNDITTFFKLY